MIGMKPKDAIELKEVTLVILHKIHCPKMDCIVTYYNPEKSMMTNVKVQRIEHGLRRLTD